MIIAIGLTYERLVFRYSELSTCLGWLHEYSICGSTAYIVYECTRLVLT